MDAPTEPKEAHSHTYLYLYIYIYDLFIYLFRDIFFKKCLFVYLFKNIVLELSFGHIHTRRVPSHMRNKIQVTVVLALLALGLKL